MWFERFNIIVLNLSRDYLPSTWIGFMPSFVDIGIFIGTIGFFILLYMLYMKNFPVISQSELKVLLKDYNNKNKYEKK